MANCNAYCGEQLPDHSLIACEDYSKGGITGFITYDCGSEPADPSNGVEIAEIIAAGKAKVVLGIKSDLPEGSEVTVDNPIGCGFPTITLTADRTLNLIDANVNEDNVAFYNGLIGKKIGALSFYECDSDRITHISPRGGLTFFGNRIVPATNGEIQTFTGQFRWREKNISNILPAPVGIFE